MGSCFVGFGSGLGLCKQPVGKCTKVIVRHSALWEICRQWLTRELFAFACVHQVRGAANGCTGNAPCTRGSVPYRCTSLQNGQWSFERATEP